MIVRNVNEVTPRPGLERIVARTVLGSVAMPPRTFTDPTMSLTEYDVQASWELTGFGGHADREELYYVIEGEGLMKVGPFSRAVVRGDAVLIPPGEKHQLVNTSQRLLRMFCLGGRPEGETPPELRAKHRAEMIVRNAASTPLTPGAEGCELRVLYREEERLFESSLLFLTDYVIQPGKANMAHAHKDREEANFILGGEGLLKGESEELKVRVGDGTYIPRGERHQFFNDSQVPLHFIHFAARV